MITFLFFATVLAKIHIMAKGAPLVQVIPICKDGAQVETVIRVATTA